LMIIANNYDFEPGYIEPVARVVMVRFGKEESGGMLRVGPVHYNHASGFWVRSPRTLGNAGGDQAVRGGAGEDRGRRYLTV
jgi:hypothetical protein